VAVPNGSRRNQNCTDAAAAAAEAAATVDCAAAMSVLSLKLN